MFAVIHEKACHYVGEDRVKAVEIFGSKSGARMVVVETLDDLEQVLKNERKEFDPCDLSCISETLHKVLDKLDENGINAENADELRKKLHAGGEKLVTEVRSLGIRGMRVVGDGLMTLGDFMRKAGEDVGKTGEGLHAQATKEENDSCCGDNCGDNCGDK